MREKLIRDLIPALAFASGRQLETRIAGEDEWDRFLAQKILEESHEVADAIRAGSREALIDELADLQTVIDVTSRRHGIERDEIQKRVATKSDERGGFDKGLVLRQGDIESPRLHVGGSQSLVDALRQEFNKCKAARLAVAFIFRGGLELLEGAMRAALIRGTTIQILTTDYLDVTEPEALESLNSWSGPIETRIYSSEAHSFHPKAYLFEYPDGSGRAFIGSANMSRMGLRDGVEWTWSVLEFDRGNPSHELRTRFDELFRGPNSHPLTPAWIAAYRLRRQVRPITEIAEPSLSVAPRVVQALALEELERLRLDGETRALVVAATGLGKTFLAAFDSRRFQRILFIAHREELLHQAAAAFRLVSPVRTQGFVGAGQSDLDRESVFATIQTLSRPEFLARDELARFDYVVVDEFHHAAADSYARALEQLRPRFLLGLTATPFRSDNRDLLSLCHGNVAYQVGLFEAIGFGWLVPFHYFGVADVVEYSDDLLTPSRTYDVGRLTLRFNTQERVNLAIEQFRTHPSKAAIGFCISIEHADFMARSFKAAGIAANAVHSGPTSIPRAEAVNALMAGDSRILFTVDLFNEGIDIPPVDLVMFLRPTESMTVFLQQLGRGLRLSDGKEFLTVLDFIGNYRNAHFKLPFLVGQESQDFDARKALLALQRWQATSARPEGIPDGIVVSLQPVALQSLQKSLQTSAPLGQLVLNDLDDVSSVVGRTPTLLEQVQLGRYSLQTMRQILKVGSWNSVLAKAQKLSPEEEALDAIVGNFYREIEATPMTKGFKMVVLLAMCASGTLHSRLPIEDLIGYFRHYYSKESHRSDVLGTRVESVETISSDVWRRYLLDNPISAWTGGPPGWSSSFLQWDGGTSELRYIGPLPAASDTQLASRFTVGIADRASARLHEYWRRPGPGRFVFGVVPIGSSKGDGAEDGTREAKDGSRPQCIMFGDHRQGLPVGWHMVKINGKHLIGKFAKVAMNVLKDVASDERTIPNLLTGELSALFEGRIPQRARVRLVKSTGSDVWEIRRA